MAQPVANKGEADVWIGRVKEFVNKPNVVTDAAPAHHAPWHNRMFGCFAPPDLCLMTCCCPCITFGKTHHRLRVDASMKDYSAVNTSCLIWWAAACVGVPCLLQMLQRHEIRSRFNLQGDGVTDFLRTWCCACCDLIQQDKEAEYHLLHGGAQTTATGAPMVSHEPEKMQQGAGMQYPPPVQQQQHGAEYPPPQSQAY